MINKLVKINHIGLIHPKSLFGPILTPMILPISEILELVSLGYEVVEVIKNQHSGEVVGEVKLTLSNYNENNYSLVSNIGTNKSEVYDDSSFIPSDNLNDKQQQEQEPASSIVDVDGDKEPSDQLKSDEVNEKDTSPVEESDENKTEMEQVITSNVQHNNYYNKNNYGKKK